MSKIINYPDKLSVLVIEDNPGDFVLIEDYLLEKFKDVTISHCSSYAESILFLEKTKETLSVLLLDLNLPDLKGLDLIKSILSYSFHVPVIVITGYSDLSMAKSSLKMGVYDFLVKDEINPDLLEKTIIYTLNRSSFINQIDDAKMNYENLFNFSPQPMWLLDFTTLKILNANFAAQIKYGYSLDEFKAMSFLAFHPEAEQPKVKQQFELNENGVFDSNHFTHFLQNGNEIKVEIYYKVLQNATSNEIIVLSNDITEMINQINTIQIQNAKLRNIAWTQSHIVRAPLSRILGIINLIEMQPDNFEDLPFLLKQLKISTNEMDDIVKKIVTETKGFTEK
ncbi:response regulator [Flavobacterium sp. UBA6135]|uniref:response regulator n=1 Tax=Flavobacterium sp. UBA6135 TaxID=1946553 RepID=UPI0025C1333E|nr:response regulator [Flavobacterium sp. UBA6135]